ncbi:thermonuclease family protein [Chitinibacter sp. S2-10]|uniref:thermonuclease family protein n=1 Tax=Chitinibacter sp. S2-10 TaxID=3373597 RepID=UPI003977622E
MNISPSQQKAIIRLITASNWQQRIVALVIVMVGAWACVNQETPQGQPGQLSANSQISGEVVGVADGDTITLLDAGKKQYKLRLAYIDAPEKAMPFGQVAKQSLSDLVYRQTVTARIDDVDRYGRGVARISKNGQDINLQQVSTGMAWHYTQYAKKTQSRSDFAAYQQAELQARDGKIGLWQDENPTPPWDWRKAKRGQ